MPGVLIEVRRQYTADQETGKWLVSCVLAHPELQNLCRWMLATLDAHGLYQQQGFTPVRRPERLMEITDPDIYTRKVQ